MHNITCYARIPNSVYYVAAVPYMVPGQDGPKIEGTRPRYEIGDLVDVNCTSAPAHSKALLKWFINDKEVS